MLLKKRKGCYTVLLGYSKHIRGEGGLATQPIAMSLLRWNNMLPSYSKHIRGRGGSVTQPITMIYFLTWATAHLSLVYPSVLVCVCVCGKGWLTNSLNLLIILNLVSEPSVIRTLLSLSPLQPTFSLPLLNGLCCYCRRILPHCRWCSSASHLQAAADGVLPPQ
jgi:hypothetical protein